MEKHGALTEGSPCDLCSRPATYSDGTITRCTVHMAEKQAKAATVFKAEIDDLHRDID